MDGVCLLGWKAPRKQRATYVSRRPITFGLPPMPQQHQDMSPEESGTHPESSEGKRVIDVVDGGALAAMEGAPKCSLLHVDGCWWWLLVKLVSPCTLR